MSREIRGRFTVNEELIKDPTMKVMEEKKKGELEWLYSFSDLKSFALSSAELTRADAK